METIIGIDPGSRVTGYGIVACRGGELRYLGSGCVHTGSGPLAERLRNIYSAVTQLVEQFRPGVMAVEETFLSKNVQSTVKLSEARASAMVAGANLGLQVFEYTPRQIKQAVVGYGAAEKQQVQFMVRQILHLDGVPQSDAADALACAICHAFTYKTVAAMSLRAAVSPAWKGGQPGSSSRGR